MAAWPSRVRRAARSPRAASPSLRLLLIGLLAAVFIPLLLVAASLLWYQWVQLRDRGTAELLEHARVLRYAMDRELTLDVVVLGGLGASSELDQADLRGFYSVATRTAQVRPGSWIVLVDRAGQNTLNTARPFGAPLPNLRRTLATPRTVPWQGRALPLPTYEIFEAPLRTGKPAFSGLVYGPVSRRPVVATNVAVMRQGQATHVLGLAYSADFYVDLLRAQVRNPDYIATIVDGAGRVVARNRAHERFVGMAAPPPFNPGHPALAPEGVGQLINLEGERSYYAYSHSQVNDWIGAVGIPESKLLEPARRALWSSLALLAPLMALAAAVAVWLSRRITRPLVMLAQRAQSPGANDADVQSSGIREVDALREALTRAAAAQARSRAELLEEARRKDEFMSMLGHELRNPLASISNVSHVLARQATADATAVRMHAILRRQTHHLSRLVDDLLDAARVNSGKLSIHRKPFALDELVRRATEEAQANFERKGLRLQVDVHDAIRIDGDEVRMAQVLTNLLDNAFKYTDEGVVEVTLKPGPGQAGEPGEAVLTVRDTGRGISADLLPRIFDAFAQHAQSIERTEGGLGLGLAIVKRVVELHGGTIQARSAGAGQGVIVEVRLPRLRT